MIGRSELRINCRAEPVAARPMRHALASFLALFEIDREHRDDILTAVGEALANAVEHAYPADRCEDIELVGSMRDDDTLVVDVYDRGTFIDRDKRPERGFGLRIVESIARSVVIDTREGTHVQMVFSARGART